jgi:sigma-B regulation protein RsbU (phosphoserine phosphatase)
MELLILGPEGGSSTMPLKKDGLSLGRAADNDLAYPNDPWLSRYHLRFEKSDQGWSVRDCESRNGTNVNSMSLKQHPHVLEPGDRIYAGHLTIEVRDSGDSSRRVMSFVAPKPSSSERHATMVTSLDKVLGQASVVERTTKDRSQTSTLSTSRVVHALIRAGRELAGHAPLEELFHNILDLSLSAVEAMRGVILTLEPNGELEVRASKGEGFSLSTLVRDRVLSAKESLMISDAQMDAALRESKSIVSQGVHSMMAAPLQTRERVIGLIYVDTGDLISPFSPEDLDLLTVMANVAAIRIEHSRLVLVEQAEKVMEMELAQASEIQRSLLPPSVPVVEGYELSGFNLPCRTVGGDYYDFIPYADGRMVLLVGDVAGKGFAASLLMSSLQARVHMLAESMPEPAPAVSALNRALAARCPRGKFITLFYAVLDPSSGWLSYANAGHNYPVLVRAKGGVEMLAGSDLVLGINGGAKYETRGVQLEAGDTLCLYSDGVTEVQSREGEVEFGETRLAQYLADRKGQPLDEAISQLAQSLREWSAQPSFADDFTMVLVRRVS